MTVFQDNIRLSSDIFYFLQKKQLGEVILTTSKGIYLQFSSGILLIASDCYGITPIGIGLSRFVDFVTEIAPQVGQSVTVSDGCIHFPGGTLNGNWDVRQPRSVFGLIHPEQTMQCARTLVSQCSDRSLAALAAPFILQEELSLKAQSNPYCTRAKPILEELLVGLRKGESEKVCRTVRHLLGLGIGLTPSMDDILLGLLYGLLRLSPQKVTTALLRDAILSYASTHTNAISAAYLETVARGNHFERLDDMIENLSANTAINIEPLLEIGSSSGSEMLFGLLLATKNTMKG